MKATRLKAWPELIDYQPSLIVFREIRPKSGLGSAPVEIDFGSVRMVSSTGLAVFLLQLLRILGNRSSPLIRQGCDDKILEQLKELGTFEILRNTLTPNQHDLFIENTIRREDFVDQQRRLSIPIYRIGFDGFEDRRRAVHRFKNWLYRQLETLGSKFKIEPNGLAMLLGEMAKNTADHTKSDALFGLDVIDIDKSKARLSFVFGDLGIGIKQHIEKNLPPEEEKRRYKMSLYEAYRFALKPGYTSNRLSKLNKGHGMSIIVDCSIDLGVHLSVFDANSRGLLTGLENVSSPTHDAIRRIFHKVGHDVGFFYYGELTILKEEI